MVLLRKSATFMLCSNSVKNFAVELKDQIPQHALLKAKLLMSLLLRKTPCGREPMRRTKAVASCNRWAATGRSALLGLLVKSTPRIRTVCTICSKAKPCSDECVTLLPGQILNLLGFSFNPTWAEMVAQASTQLRAIWAPFAMRLKVTCCICVPVAACTSVATFCSTTARIATKHKGESASPCGKDELTGIAAGIHWYVHQLDWGAHGFQRSCCQLRVNMVKTFLKI